MVDEDRIHMRVVSAANRGANSHEYKIVLKENSAAWLKVVVLINRRLTIDEFDIIFIVL